MKLRAAKNQRRLEYFAASATLGRLHDTGGPLAKERIPDVLGLTSQFRPLVELWIQANDDLKAYDRAHRKAGSDKLTGDMYEALPAHLRQGDHPHFDDWYKVMDQSVTEDGWTVVAISELAKIEKLTKRKKLTKAQSLELAGTATGMGLALEPDPRITGKAYEWDDVVSVFPATEELSEDVASYHAAAVLLELGVAIAASDGQIDEIELARLSSHLESQFELSTQDSARLEHLRYLLVRKPSTEFSAARSLQKRLTIEQRQTIGEFLVGIAAADEQIEPDEVKALGRAYRALGLDAEDLAKLLRSVAAPDAAAPDEAATPSIRLDRDRIQSIMSETAKVTEFLRDAFRDDPESDSPSDESVDVPEPESRAVVTTISTPNSSDDDRFPGLDSRFVSFAVGAIVQTRWAREELEQVARERKVMLGAAVERINEWSYNAFGDALLIENDDVLEVQIELLK